MSSCGTASSYPIPPSTLPEDFIDPCQDSNSNCLTWSQEGECNDNKNYMVEFCPRSCGSCRPIQSLQKEETITTTTDESESNTNCIDSRIECPQWAGGGECFINPTFMLKACRYSCWKCVNIPKDRERGIDERITANKELYSKMNVGKNQVVFRQHDNDDSLKQKLDVPIFETLLSMEKYAKTVIADPNVPKKVRERCSNHHRMCAIWAAQGKCIPYGHDERHEREDIFGKESVIFMMNMCPLACQMCHETILFHQCSGKRLPWEKASFDSASQSINSFFERIDPRFEPTFVSRPDKDEESSKGDPYVVLLRNFLSIDEADALKSLPSSTATGGDLHTVANRVVASCANDNDCSQNETYKTIMDRISTLMDVDANHLEPIEIIQFNQHNTNAQLKHNYEIRSLWMPAGPRLISIFIFLSDVSSTDEQQGIGGIGFPYLDWLSIKPRKGMAVIWPNVRNDDLWRPDPLTKFEYHSILESAEVGTSVHFGAMSHVRLYNYTDAYLRGCT